MDFQAKMPENDRKNIFRLKKTANKGTVYVLRC